MYEIAHGIDIYYDNQKSTSNIIRIQNGDIVYYSTSELLFEVISDLSNDLLTNKAQAMIELYPLRDKSLSQETIVDGFKWLYGTVVDDSLSISTELFRSSFGNAIYGTLATQDKFNNTGDFFDACYNNYINDYNSFITYLICLALYKGDYNDEEANKLAEGFLTYYKEYIEIYKQKCTKRINKETAKVYMYNISTFMELLLFIYSRLPFEKSKIRICSNCQRIFLTRKRTDQLYCNNISPQDPNKTCKEIGAKERRRNKVLNNNELYMRQKNIDKYQKAYAKAMERGDGTAEYHKKKLEKEKQKKIYI